MWYLHRPSPQHRNQWSHNIWLQSGLCYHNPHKQEQSLFQLDDLKHATLNIVDHTQGKWQKTATVNRMMSQTFWKLPNAPYP